MDCGLFCSTDRICRDKHIFKPPKFDEKETDGSPFLGDAIVLQINGLSRNHPFDGPHVAFLGSNFEVAVDNAVVGISITDPHWRSDNLRDG